MRAVPGFVATLSDRAGVTELRLAGPDVLRPIKEMLLAILTLRARQLPLQPIEVVFTRHLRAS